ncbi:MAG: D-alanyl-lipoteichoic acid biosynthesis protein DltD [Flavobacteriales bacterium]
MKIFCREHIIPFCIALGIILCLDLRYWYWYENMERARPPRWREQERLEIDKHAAYGEYAGWDFRKWNIAQALHSKKAIVLFGSSELTSSSPYLTGPFFKDSLQCSLISLGHAGNQCMSIMAQLMAFKHYNEGARVAIIVSPGWFMDHYARGTALQPFLEYNDVEMINAALSMSEPHGDALARYALQHASDFEGASKDIDHAMDHYLWKSKPHQALLQMISHGIKHHFQRKPKPTYFDGFALREWPADAVRYVDENFWHGIEAQAILQHEVLCSNNPWGVNNAYYNKHLKSEKKKIVAVANEYNQELRDFTLLVSYIQSRKMDAVFVMQPLNPLAYENLKTGDATMDAVSEIIHQSGYSYLNLYTSDSTDYQRALLNDVMHFGDYGFLKMNQFIYNHYVATTE